jgi:hypothetical protein
VGSSLLYVVAVCSKQGAESVVVQFEIHRRSNPVGPVGKLWVMPKRKTVLKKATKKAIGDKQRAKAIQRHALRRKVSVDELEDRPNEDFSRAAARIVREATKN